MSLAAPYNPGTDQALRSTDRNWGYSVPTVLDGLPPKIRRTQRNVLEGRPNPMSSASSPIRSVSSHYNPEVYATPHFNATPDPLHPPGDPTKVHQVPTNTQTLIFQLHNQLIRSQHVSGEIISILQRETQQKSTLDSQLRAEVAKLSEELRLEQAEAANLRKEWTRDNAALTQTEAMAATLWEKLMTATHGLKWDSGRLNGLDQTVRDLRARLRTTNGGLRENKQKLKQSDTAVAELSTEVATVKEECSKVKDALRKAEATITGLRDELAEEQKRKGRPTNDVELSDGTDSRIAISQAGIPPARAVEERDRALAAAAVLKGRLSELLQREVEFQARRYAALDKSRTRKKARHLERKEKEKESGRVREELSAEKIRSSNLAIRVTEAEEKLAAFHFGMQILESYFQVMLKDQDISKDPLMKRQQNGLDDEHDFWDIQAAMKSLLVKLAPYVQEIRDRSDFEQGEIQCPLCRDSHSQSEEE